MDKEDYVKRRQQSPAFNLPGNDGKNHRLSEYLGKKVVLYFYLKDNTPGCTTEACDFRDNMAKLKRQGTVVLGVSKDSIASHDKFIAKHDLTLFFYSPMKTPKSTKKYGAWGGEKYVAQKVHGLYSLTFLIDEKGKLATWNKVRVKGHVDEVLETIKSL